MKARVYHLQINVLDPRVSFPFYKDLLGYLEYRVVHEEGDVAGFSNGTTDLWLIATEPRHARRGFHRKRAGINHVAFRVAQREDVERFRTQFLAPRRIDPLYGTPREFPVYRPGYYAVFFEDPDRLKLEVVHVPGA